MSGRTRTTKKLAQRIDLDYFKRLSAIPRGRRSLTIGLTLVAVLWLGWSMRSGKQQAFNAGPLAPSHALISQNCAACHAAAGGFARSATDAACLACHDGPVHQAGQLFAPSCQDCHTEHTGVFRLAMTDDRGCTACHSNLAGKDGRTRFSSKITGWNTDHPEFALIRSGQKDPGTVKFGHQLHLKKDLRGPTGPVQMKCTDCHQLEQRALAPVNFEKHCASCHPLIFDQRISEPAPHQSPQIVRGFVTAKFTSYIAAHRGEIGQVDSSSDVRIARVARPPARSAAEWVSQATANAELLLWRKACRECHQLQYPAGASLPEIPKAAIASRWLLRAEFDHQKHQLAPCADCHDRAAASQEASDLLLPGIQTCRQCHRPGPGAADARCSECHLYHDWSKEKPVDGKFVIRNVR